MARLKDVLKEGDTAYQELVNRRVPIYIEDDLSFVMDMDPEFLTEEDTPGPTKTEMDQFQKKFKMLTKTELEAAMRVSPEDLLSILSQMVACVGCKRSAESMFQKGVPSYGFYPLCVDEKGIMYLAKDQMTPKFLCSMFHSSSLVESLIKCKSGRRCALQSLQSQRMARQSSSWVDVWDCMDEKCQQRTFMVDSKLLIETTERYLTKHRFCTDCKSEVFRAFKMLTGELDPTSEPGFIAQLYEGIEYCRENRHLNLLSKTEFVNRLIVNAIPKLAGSSRRETHAETIELAQKEVLICIGLYLFERLRCIQQRFREEEKTWKIIMCIAFQALRRSFEVAVENKLRVSQLDLMSQELSTEEISKQQRKEGKKLNRNRKKGKKTEHTADAKGESLSDQDEAVEEKAVTVEMLLTKSSLESEVEIKEAQDEDDSSQWEIFGRKKAPSKGIKKRIARKRKAKKGNVKASSGLPLQKKVDELNEKVESKVQKGSVVSFPQESRCALETSRDDDNFTNSTVVIQAHTTCGSVEGSETSCADDGCQLSAGFSLDFLDSDDESIPPQGNLLQHQ